MNRALLLAVAAAALLAASCKGNGGPAETYCEEYYDALAARDRRCGFMDAQYSGYWAERSKAYYCGNARRLAEAGQVTYDSASGESCLAFLEAASCTTTLDSPDDACARALAGVVAAGGACFDGQECGPGTVCAGGSACPGTCEPLGKKGEACGTGGCELGLRCVGGKCAVNGAEGESCVSGECQAGLWCGPISEKCRPTGALESGGCEGYADCAPGYLCLGSDYSTQQPGTCTRGKELNEGCAPGECLAGFCKAGRCADRPAIGEPCGLVDGDYAACRVGYCSSEASQGSATSGTCLAHAGIGEPCTSFVECEFFAWCDETSRVCKPSCSP